MKNKHVFLLVALTLIISLITYRAFVPGKGIEKQREKLNKAKEYKRADNESYMISAAYLAAKQIITKNLKSPSTAKFSQSWEKETIISNIDSVYTVQLQVDSQNSYGAMIRSVFTVKMTYHSNTDTFTVNDISK